MATLNDLIVELETNCDAPAEFLEEVKSVVAEYGKGLYTINTEYGNFQIHKDSNLTVEEVRAEVQANLDADVDEDERWDYFEDFNDEDTPKGFLFGEGWFCVDITEV